MLPTIFGGNTGITYEDLKRKQLVAESLLAQSSKAPRNVGEGLTAIGNALAGRVLSNRAEKRQKEMDKNSAGIMAALLGGGTPPIMPPRTDTPNAGPVTPNTGAPETGGDGSLDAIVNRIIGVESDGDPNAKNPRSTATGLGQFIDSTWLDMIGRHRPDLAKGLSRQEVLGLRKNPKLSREMTRLFTMENAESLRKRGMAPTPGNIYLSHFLGAGGAGKALSADDNASVASVLGEGVVKANPFLRGWSIGKLKAWSDRKMGGAVGGAGAPTTPPATGGAGTARIAQLMGALANGNLSPQHRRIAEMMLAQEMARNKAPDPMAVARLEMERERLGLSKNADARAERLANAKIDGTIKTGTTVNVGGNGVKYADPPKNHDYLRNPDGTVKVFEDGRPRVAPISGGPADVKAEDAAKKQRMRDESTVGNASLMSETIARARDQVKEAPEWRTGLLGQVLQTWGGTGANDLRATLDTIKANIGFDRLTQMRAESPTGGALGAVSERELTLLQSVIASIDQSQSAEQLIKNLETIEKKYNGIMRKFAAYPEFAGDTSLDPWRGKVPGTPGAADATAGLDDAKVPPIPEAFSGDEELKRLWPLMTDEDRKLWMGQ